MRGGLAAAKEPLVELAGMSELRAAAQRSGRPNEEVRIRADMSSRVIHGSSAWHNELRQRGDGKSPLWVGFSPRAGTQWLGRVAEFLVFGWYQCQAV